MLNELTRRILDRRVSVAPMMDWTDRHCRYFLRAISPNSLLYTEMITTGAILRGDRARLLAYDPAEHPVALQLGGSEPGALAAAAQIGADLGYDEVNLNCGCPSDRVHSGSFGACLMREPALVAECVAAMRAVVSIPVTVKLRIGVLDGKALRDARHAASSFDAADRERLHDFVARIVAAGCQAVIVHARKAVLGTWSPKDNREIPVLHHDVVRDVKHAFPQVPVVLNGGLKTAAQVVEQLRSVDGVMLGREAYHRPMVLADVDAALGHAREPVSRSAVLATMAAYCERELARGERLSNITRHLLGLYAGEPGAREYRRRLSEGARAPGVGPELLADAAAASECITAAVA
jgi:tRNA-dihydrouridine synthase A